MTETTTSPSNRERGPKYNGDSLDTNTRSDEADFSLYKLLDLEIQTPSHAVVDRILIFSRNSK